MFDLKWSSEHAGALPNLRWPRNSAPRVRNRTCAHRLPRDFPELHALLANLPSQKIALSLQFPSGSRGNCQRHRVAQTNTQSAVKTTTGLETDAPPIFPN